jgi:hypothetical protein
LSTTDDHLAVAASTPLDTPRQPQPVVTVQLVLSAWRLDRSLWTLAVVSDASTVELRERLARLEAALAERDAVIEALQARSTPADRRPGVAPAGRGQTTPPARTLDR